MFTRVMHNRSEQWSRVSIHRRYNPIHIYIQTQLRSELIGRNGGSSTNDTLQYLTPLSFSGEPDFRNAHLVRALRRCEMACVLS